MRSPRNRPTTDASVPTTSASTMIERSTCLREAPSVRSVASSRVRCAIVIESEFAMTNEPTKSAMPPNASRNPRRNEMNEFVSAASDFTCCADVFTSASDGQDRANRPHELRGRDVRLRGDRDLVELPSLVGRGSAPSARSKPASVAPPIVRPELNCMIPAIRNVSTGPSTCTSMF